MKPSLRLPQAPGPLPLAFLAALVLHALLLSYLQLQRSRRPPAPMPPVSRDNTPELLQFSSQAASVPSLAVLPLPTATLLPPPPPPDLLAPQDSPRASGNRAGRTAPAAGQNKGGRLRRTVSPPGSAGRKVQPAGMPSLASRSGGTQQEEMARALEVLRATVRSTGAVAESSSSPEGPKAGSTAPTELEPEKQAAYQALWNSAQPLALPPERSGAAGGDPPVEMRQLPLPKPGDAPSIAHRQIVRLGDNLLLFWVSGQQLWILQSPRSLPQ